MPAAALPHQASRPGQRPRTTGCGPSHVTLGLPNMCFSRSWVFRRTRLARGVTAETNCSGAYLMRPKVVINGLLVILRRLTNIGFFAEPTARAVAVERNRLGPTFFVAADFSSCLRTNGFRIRQTCKDVKPGAFARQPQMKFHLNNRISPAITELVKRSPLDSPLDMQNPSVSGISRDLDILLDLDK